MESEQSNVVQMPLWRNRAKPTPIYYPLPQAEPKLLWEHWAIGIAIVGSITWAVITLIVG